MNGETIPSLIVLMHSIPLSVPLTKGSGYIIFIFR
jgi:hypothetical protein